MYHSKAEAKFYHPNGNLWFCGLFRHNLRNGHARVYGYDGVFLFDSFWDSGVMASVEYELDFNEYVVEDSPKIGVEKVVKEVPMVLEWRKMNYDHRIVNGRFIFGVVDERGNLSRGVEYDSNGLKFYEGAYGKELREGLGIEFHANGNRIYDGMWQCDKKNGQGTKFDKDGNKLFYGIMKSDKYFIGSGILLDDIGNLKYRGTWKNGTLQEGFGTEMFKNGLKSYEGDFKSNKFCGKGTAWYINGKKSYHGDFSRGVFNGKGIRYSKDNEEALCSGIWRDGRMYGIDLTKREQSLDYLVKSSGRNQIFSGQMKNHLKHGEGTLHSDTGLPIYKGSYKMAKRQGRGTQYKEYFVETEHSRLKFNMVRYEGRWLQDKREGKGISYHGTANKQFDGYYVNGLREGQGIEYFYDSSAIRYEGSWKEGLKHGFGASYYLNRVKKYEGEYHKNLRHGFGCSYSLSHDLVYSGHYKLGMKHGPGKLYSYTVLIYHGDFKYGTRDGHGSAYHENGKRQYTGTWHKDHPRGSNQVHTDDHGRLGLVLWNQDDDVLTISDDDEEEDMIH
jgi:antitoxin component YwqK of YwqJK toxin-antitoxin module